MSKLICPSCENTFYTAVLENSLNCPYCSIIISHRESDRRYIDRVTANLVCELISGEISVPAKTVDISETGFGIRMRGYLPFERDEEVGVNFLGLNNKRKAKVVWTKKHYGTSRAGLCYADRKKSTLSEL